MTQRSLHFENVPEIATLGNNHSLHYADHWLSRIGLSTVPYVPGCDAPIVLVAGAQDVEAGAKPIKVMLWDFHTDMPGTGLQAAAASGICWVLGNPGQAPLALPLDMPEKWCGLTAANIVLALLLDLELRGTIDSKSPSVHRYDVSAADVLRCFADQNADHEALKDAVLPSSLWRRNGSVAVDHGGIFPQGFYPCRDGWVGVIGRSRRDWKAIRAVIGDPAWANDTAYQDPFALALQPGDADRLFAASLLQFDRDDLLARSIELGATIAPVYNTLELASRDVVRQDFFDAQGNASLPFEIFPHHGEAVGAQT